MVCYLNQGLQSSPIPSSNFSHPSGRSNEPVVKVKSSFQSTSDAETTNLRDNRAFMVEPEWPEYKG